MPMSGLPEDAVERFFEKSSEKRERFQNFWQYTRCADFFQKSGTVFKIFGNIPDVRNFLKKEWAISDFLHMYYDDNRRNVWKRVSTKKVTIFSKAVGKNRDIRERNWIESKKITIFFKSGETKTGCSGDKLGRVNFFRISSKMVELNRSSRERNWTVVKNFGFLQKWW